MVTRLTPLDGSFLRLETPNAHMHVAWSGTFTPHPKRPRPTIRSLQALVGGRIRHAPRFRQRIESAPLGIGEPWWVDDENFDVALHVRAMSGEREHVTRRRFESLCDAELSRPLERSRPLWEVHFAPRLADETCGILVKMHHAMVDGKSAVELALLLFDLSPDAEPDAPDDWAPAARPSGSRLALGALSDSAVESLRLARGAARLATPRGGGRLADTLRRTALAVGEDLLRPAPPSRLNVTIGPRRTLVRHRAAMPDLVRVKDAAGATLNDVCLAAVSGALRELALASGKTPLPLKAMVPVSVRSDHEAAALGNRISFAFVDLPIDIGTAHGRLAAVRQRTGRFKDAARPAAVEGVLGTLGYLPDPLRTSAARAAGSSRVYNLTVSNVPGPRVPVYMLGAELREAYPVVPLSEKHALSIGIFTYREHAHFGFYADPEAFPDVRILPQLMNVAVLALARSRRRSRLGSGAAA